MEHEELLKALRDAGWRAEIFGTGDGPDILQVYSRSGAFFQSELDKVQDILDFHVPSWDVRFLFKAGASSAQFELY